MSMVRINLGMPAALLKRLDKFAEKKALDRNNAIRQFIAEGLDAEERRERERLK